MKSKRCALRVGSIRRSRSRKLRVMDRFGRREFLRTASGVTLLTPARVTPEGGGRADPAAPSQPAETSQADRTFWITVARRLADPVLSHLATGTLKANMPVEQAAGSDRQSVTHLEALGR